MAFVTKVQKMGVAALLLGVSVFLSRFMGLVRDKVISWNFGASSEADIYFTSFVIPDFINYLLAGGYFSITLIPLLSACFEHDKNSADVLGTAVETPPNEKKSDSGQSAWHFFSAAFWWVSIIISCVTAVAWWHAPRLAELAAPGFDADAVARLSYFLRIILPAQICFLMGACLTALLYQRRQFTIPAMTPLVYNGCIILGGLAMLYVAPERGMEGFCWGVLVGALLGSFVLPLWAVWRGGFTLHLTLRHPYVKRFLLLALPLMIGQSVVVLDEQFVRIFGSLAGEGAVSLLNYARRIMLVPVGVVAQAAGLASYPFLAALAAKGDTKAFDATLSSALRNTLVVIIPLAAWMIVAAEPTLRLIFEGGDFGAQQTQQAVPLLQVMLCGVAFWAIQQVVGRAFYAQQDTVSPAVVGTIATALSLPLYALWAKDDGALGVAMAGVAAVVLYTLILGILWAYRHGRGGLQGMVKTSAVSVLLTLPAAALAWWPAVHLPNIGVDCISKNTILISYTWLVHPILWALVALGVSFLIFLLVYISLVWYFMPEMLRPIVERFQKKYARS
ncbi:MAG: murein biosynthesis integral membrane protein MurJ [Pseudomonadota bacterium]